MIKVALIGCMLHGIWNATQFDCQPQPHTSAFMIRTGEPPAIGSSSILAKWLRSSLLAHVPRFTSNMPRTFVTKAGEDRGEAVTQRHAIFSCD